MVRAMADSICGLDGSGCDTIVTIKRVMFSFTITFDVITLFTIVVLRKYQTLGEKIFLNILISDLGEAISTQMSDGTHDEIFCGIVGFLCQFFGFALFLWVCSLIVFLFTLIHLKENRRPKLKTYLLCCWLGSLLWSCLPLTTQHMHSGYGPAGAFCWVAGTTTIAQAWRFIIWWGPVILGVFIIFLTIVFMHCKEARNPPISQTAASARRHKKLVKDTLRPLTAYGATFVVIHILMFIDRLSTINPGTKPILVLRILHIVAFASYGIVLCSLFYILTEKKDFTVANFRTGLKYHKRVLMCKSKSKITAERMNTALATVADIPISVCFNDRNDGINERRVSSHSVEYSFPANSIYRQHSTNRDEAPDTPTDVCLPSFPSQSNRRHDSAASDDELSLRSLQEAFESCPTERVDCERPLETVVELPSPKSSLDISSDLSQQSKTGSAFSPVQETECIREGGCETVTPTASLQPIDFHTTEILPQHTFTIEPEAEILRVYYKDNHSKWENWHTNETVHSWVTRIKEDLPQLSTVEICDKDGVFFGKSFTWKQIKSFGNIRIIINGVVTDIEISDISKTKQTHCSDNQAHL